MGCLTAGRNNPTPNRDEEMANTKNLLLALAVSMAMFAIGETVTNVRGSQRQDSKLVDIYYDLNATDGETYTVAVEVEGRTNAVTASTFTGDVGEGVSPGTNRHVVWDAGADWPDKKGDVRAVVTATKENPAINPGKVQLWEGGPYWADRNIGADKPEDYGLYFWWGDTTGHRPSGFNFSADNSTIYTWCKSVSELQSAGWMTSDGVLVPLHDAAHVKWGGSWRMPTRQEFEDLNSKCDWTLKTMNGVNGYVVRGRGDYAANSIFLPCAGHVNGTSLYFAGSCGRYWSSVQYTRGSYYDTWYLEFNSSGHDTNNGSYDNDGRYDGQSIRPVQGRTSETDAATDISAWFFVDTTDKPLTLEAESADWSEGSITLCCTDADTSGVAHTYTLQYYNESNTQWVDVTGNDARVTIDANGNVHLTDKGFSSRLGGIPPVKYRVSDENNRLSAECVTRTRYGIFVGVGHYSEEYQKKCMWYCGGEPLEDLPEVEGNTQRYAELARDNGDFTFTERPLLGTSATTENVDAAFITTAGKVSPGDVCLFYVSTHGGVLSEDNGGLKKGTAVLALYDDDYSEFQLKDGIDLLSAKNAAVVCILSACQSEALVQQCRANVAVIAAANYQGSSTALFDEILMDYGWSEGWAGSGDTFSLSNLAFYAKAQYDEIFSGVLIDEDGELTTWNVQVEDGNDLLSKIMVRTNGSHENLLPPAVPENFKATQAEYKDCIEVSWSASPDADLYFVFYGRHADSVYDDFEQTNKTRLIFKSSEYKCVELSSHDSPAFFEIRAFNGAGVSPSAVTEGWINTRRIVTFDAKGGEPGIWQGILPVEGKLYIPYEKGAKLGTLPIPSRNGFTYVCWYKETGLMTVVATADTEVEEDITYYAKWTDMTLEYLSAHPKIVVASGNNIATAAMMPAANGCRTVGECYALGIDPEDPDDDLRITAFRKEDGQPVITVNHTTDGSGKSFEDRIRTLGKKTLIDAEWVDVTDKDQSEYRFFKVSVELP